jgi:hypothetical protein
VTAAGFVGRAGMTDHIELRHLLRSETGVAVSADDCGTSLHQQPVSIGYRQPIEKRDKYSVRPAKAYLV